MSPFARCVSLIAVVVLAPFVAAHDMWLVPPGAAAPGEPVEVVFSVGMDFPTSTSAIDPARLAVVLRAPAGAQAPAAGVELDQREAEGRTLGRFVPDAPGAWIVATSTAPKLLPQEAKAFNDYLLHDGMPHVLAWRLDADELDEPAVERYSKFVKTLVPVGRDVDAARAASTPLGQKLEIVLLDDPLAARVGDTLRARVLFDGEPLPGAHLCWDLPGNGEAFGGSALTDAAGEALVPVVQPGLTTLRLVHMTRPRAADYEWESFWASFTVRIAADPVAQPSGSSTMQLGAFSVSLAVKDLAASRAFYEKFGFEVAGGDASQNWLILRNGPHVLGLFQGMFEQNILTFNPGWDQHAQPLGEFTDVRELQKQLEAAGVELLSRADEDGTGPASLTALDPDGNPILIDQHL